MGLKFGGNLPQNPNRYIRSWKPRKDRKRVIEREGERVALSSQTNSKNVALYVISYPPYMPSLIPTSKPNQVLFFFPKTFARIQREFRGRISLIWWDWIVELIKGKIKIENNFTNKKYFLLHKTSIKVTIVLQSY